MGRFVYDAATTLNGWIADESSAPDGLCAVDDGGLPPDGTVPSAAAGQFARLAYSVTAQPTERRRRLARRFPQPTRDKVLPGPSRTRMTENAHH